MATIDQVLQLLENTIEADDFLDICENAAEELQQLPNPFDAVEPILKLMEKHDYIDFGMPGPLAHFVETFYRKGYEAKLIESLKRRPTEHTLWMLNRIINGVEGEQRESLLQLLDEILARPDLRDNAREAAKEFRAQHKE